MENSIEAVKEVLTRARQEVAKVIIGQDEVIEKSLIAIFTNQHVLIEGVPGIAKTFCFFRNSLIRVINFMQICLTAFDLYPKFSGTYINKP